jgi:hypothetical protein
MSSLKALFLGLAVLFLAPLAARAQTSCGFAFGQALSSAALNNCTKTKLDVGGAIDGSPIGQSTPAAGAFTTLTVNGVSVTPPGGVNILSTLNAAQIASVLAQDNALDVTSAVQAAINANANKTLVFPAGNYKISAAETILHTISIYCEPGAQFVLATQNQNGFVLGDGTDATKANTYHSSIKNCTFIPLPGVTASTSGAAIYVNDAAFFDLDRNTVYGLDGATNKLFNGVQVYIGSDFSLTHSLFQHLAGAGITTSGASGLANRTVDGRIDYNEFSDIAGDGVYLGTDTAGMTVNSAVAYNVGGWGIHVNPGTPGPNAQNIFIVQPDLEVEPTSAGGLYHQSGGVVQVVGGWIGANGSTGTIPGIKQDSGANELTVLGTSINGVPVTVSGAADNLTGVQLTGDNATQTVGLTVNATATDLNITGGRYRQWTQDCINIVGSPTRVNITGPVFKSCGVAEINGQSFAPGSLPPQISGSQTDASNALTAAASITLHNGRSFYQVTGATTITSMTSLGNSVRITIQAGAGGITFNSGGNIQLKTAPLSVPAFATVSFVNDGQNWFQDGSNF